ncbi:MAG: serine dehydratase subunit alpha family protein [Deltaproteobacteria bacterium]|nr:serine dehydratase subunit alpha family protein [Deltaproteobacteria bacterium]
MEELKRSSFQDLIRAVEDLPPSVVALLRKTIDLNKKAAEVGLAQPLGLGIGFHQSHDEGSLDMTHYVSSVAAAGSDARMSGYSLEVMSSAGSGNQGIVATMTVVAYCEYFDVEEDRLLRALALSHLVTMYVTTHVGALSALCGAAIKAGIGAACGLTYAMGGEMADICRAVKIAVASISGMVCDGAKPGCALKVSSSSEVALRAASLAMKKVQVSDADGIVASTAEETIRNLARLERSMTAVDDEIVQIMEQKFRQHRK